MEITVAIFTTFLIIIYQDFRDRAISWWLIPITILLGIGQSMLFNHWKLAGAFALQNVLFVTFQLIMLSLYFSLKEKKWVNIIDQWLGLGDVLFFLGLATFFSCVNFIAFFIGSIIITLLMFGLIIFFLKKIKTIPLAGAMALCYILLLFFLKFQTQLLYQDEYLLSWLLNLTN